MIIKHLPHRHPLFSGYEPGGAPVIRITSCHRLLTVARLPLPPAPPRRSARLAASRSSEDSLPMDNLRDFLQGLQQGIQDTAKASTSATACTKPSPKNYLKWRHEMTMFFSPVSCRLQLIGTNSISPTRYHQPGIINP